MFTIKILIEATILGISYYGTLFLLQAI